MYGSSIIDMNNHKGEEQDLKTLEGSHSSAWKSSSFMKVQEVAVLAKGLGIVIEMTGWHFQGCHK
jgi:hypothetical protein